MPHKKIRARGLFDRKALRSKKMVEKERLGDLPNDGKDWTDQELDLFFDLYFVNRPFREICRRTGRGISGVQTIIWKVAEQYRGLTYQPGQTRKQRRDKAFNAREKAFVKLCRRSGKTTIEQTATWCCRPIENIKEIWDQCL